MSTHWSQLGTSTTDCSTFESAMRKAKLDWNVSLEDMFVYANPIDDQIHVPNKKAVLRDDNESVLGVVGSQYMPVQNIEAFQFMDNLVDDSQAQYESAGYFNDGKTVWILMKLDKTLDTKNTIDPYLLLVNTHDGSGALKVLMTPIRISCENTIRMAIRKANNVFSLRHTQSIKGKINQAREVLGFADKYFKAFTDEVNDLSTQKTEDSVLDDVFDTLFPKPDYDTFDRIVLLNEQNVTDDDEKFVKSYERSMDTRNERRRTIYNHYLNDEDYGNAWGILNAFNTYEIWNGADKKNRLEQKAKRLTQSPTSSLTDQARKEINRVLHV